MSRVGGATSKENYCASGGETYCNAGMFRKAELLYLGGGGRELNYYVAGRVSQV